MTRHPERGLTRKQRDALAALRRVYVFNVRFNYGVAVTGASDLSGVGTPRINRDTAKSLAARGLVSVSGAEVRAVWP